MVPGVYVFEWTISDGACTPSFQVLLQLLIMLLPQQQASGQHEHLRYADKWKLRWQYA